MQQDTKWLAGITPNKESNVNYIGNNINKKQLKLWILLNIK